MPTFSVMTLIPMGGTRITRHVLRVPKRRASRSVHSLQSNSLVGTTMDGTLFSMISRFLLASTLFLIDLHLRFSVSSKVVHEVVCHSGVPLSNSELELSDSSSPGSPHTSNQLKTPVRSSNPSHIVSEPKHKAVKEFHSATSVVLPQL